MTGASIEPIQAVRRHAGGCEWDIVTHLPEPGLRRYVRSYVAYTEQTCGVTRHREIPRGEVTMVLNLGPQLRLLGAERPEWPGRGMTAFVAGLQETVAVYEHAGLIHGLQVTFTPLGGRLFLQCPMDLVANSAVALDDVLGRAGKKLWHRLEEAPDDRSRFRLLDALIASRVAEAPEPSKEIAWAWQMLDRSHGSVRIGDLCAEVGFTPKRLIGAFRKEVGLLPKAVARILRFDRAGVRFR